MAQQADAEAGVSIRYKPGSAVGKCAAGYPLFPGRPCGQCGSGPDGICHEDYRRLIRLEVQELQMPGAWRSIDTAPKDGRDIILWGPCRMEGDARSFAKDANIGWWCASEWRTRTNEICKATHWMPLPTPPKVTP